MEKIDFVIPWVDGSDPGWLAVKNRFEKESFYETTSEEANSECRYRPYEEMLHYWFRGVEKCAPWVNKVFFVTCGQKPDWLDEKNDKLVLVNHEDYIPSEYLPTFCIRTVELNLNRLKELSEKFVLFNDDIFLLQPVEPTFFFKGDAPVLDADLKYSSNFGYNNWSRVMFNNYCVVNKSFDIRKSIWENRKKWFNPKALGIKRAGNNVLCFMVNKTLPVSQYGHLAFPHLKSSFEEIWNDNYSVLNKSCLHRFRADEQVNQHLLCAWNQAKGRFYPANKKHLGVKTWISPNTLDGIVDVIRNRKAPQICLNDNVLNTEPEHCALEIVKALESIFPEKSSFEK